MNGFLLINKEKDYTSRDVVNIVENLFNIKKVGHTGTLDPMAEGLLVVCIGKGTKLIELMTNDDKEYIAEITLGIKTDTGDITGSVLNEEKVIKTKEEIFDALQSMTKTYQQKVPIYSAVKIKGKKLYEYAREKKEVELPSREVSIKKIELLSDITYRDNKTVFTIKCLVSKGTYIRSLIEDIAEKLNTIGTMSKLTRTKVGKFDLKGSNTINDLKNNNYNLYPLIMFFEDTFKVKVNDPKLLFKLRNGNKIKNTYNKNEILFLDKKNDPIALYINDKKEKDLLRVWKMF